jgi:hypothetical protein
VIDAIDIEQLARPSSGAEYEPLVPVGDLHCWPSAPVLDRIDPRDREQAVHAEEFFYQSRSSTTLRLQRRKQSGRGDGPGEGTFDKVVFGIPVACIPYLCSELRAGNWRSQEAIATAQTVALQIWSKATLSELGWTRPPPLLSLFWDPLNTWCDMSQTLAHEPWSDAQRPAMVAYFCGPLPHQWPGREADRVRGAFDLEWRRRLEAQAEKARDDLLARLGHLWPHFDAAHRGRELQYLRVNYDPHERCTLALPRQSKLRIHSDETGFANLTVAGDWTANHLLVPCLEGAVQSGIRAARAVSEERWRYRIIGEDLLDPGGARGGPPSRGERQPAARRPPRAAARPRSTWPGPL